MPSSVPSRVDSDPGRECSARPDWRPIPREMIEVIAGGGGGLVLDQRQLSGVLTTFSHYPKR